jgi:glutamate dehydrogenase/leucine dehydrogenase
MKFLIAGLGSIGRRHFRNLIALGEKDIVLLRSHRATLSDDELAGHPVETDLAEALKKHKPDAVIVANPTALHLDIAIPAAQAGCWSSGDMRKLLIGDTIPLWCEMQIRRGSAGIIFSSFLRKAIDFEFHH